MTIFYDNRTDCEIGEDIKSIIENVITETLVYENYTQNVEISLSFVTNDEIKMLNNQYRDKDKITDVLSFPLGDENPETKEIMLGDIVISLDKAREQANEYGHEFKREIGFLTVHSMLHLLEYDHENKEDEEEMFKRQEDILVRVGLDR
ncbi:MAG TPA: rRNA maturation RNase YbeY [Clostridiales bacterium]|nr:MAG: rRNA maturation RNase YbeY [Clostridiales bacterium GWD2_32_59]HAN10150.1 rRNA maturation RNase YbeY [Clostridiales bacterium]